jgi:hypothetical protein
MKTALLIVLTCILSIQLCAAKPNVYRKALAHSTEIQGYSCAKGYAWFYPDGKLESCAVSQDTQFGEALIPRESIISLKSDGRPNYAMLQHSSEIAGVKCSGGNWLLGPSEGAMTVFYPSGKLQLCYLAGDQVVQGVPCMHEESILSVAYGIAVKRQNNDPDIEFYESGKLRSCMLANDYGGQKKNTLWKSAAK